MHITVLGTGYVGLVTGACLAELGNHVTCLDVNQDKISALKRGEIPIYEPGLEAMVKRNFAAQRLVFITDLAEQHTTSEIYYVAVGTPSDAEGRADLQYVLQAVRMLGQHITHYCVIVDKSTVPVGVADQVHAAVRAELDQRGLSHILFDVVSNPEFLKEGAAIEDFMQPDRLVIGYPTETAKALMTQLYLPIIRNHGGKILYMSVKDAEMTKYAVNAMLATRISFMNEMAGMCERLGVDVENVRLGIGSDSRVGEKFLYPGCGYGGSCFPKDVKALISMAKQAGFAPLVLEAVEARNALQKQVLAEKVVRILGEDLTGMTIAVWGLAFKPETDDMREASSLVFVEEILARGAHIAAYDPVATDSARRIFPAAYFSSGRLRLLSDQYAVMEGAEILVVLTEWKSFLYPDLAVIKSKLKQPVILDGRNIYDPQEMQAHGFFYGGIGRGALQAL